MTFIDSHTHLYLDAFDDDRHEVIKRAISSGVEFMLFPNIDSQSVAPMEKTCSQFKNHCFPMMGLHPTHVDESYEQELATIRKHLDNNNYIAVGEIGIDLYWDKTFRKEQTEVFRTQIGWAIQKQLPIVIHARDSFEEIYDVVADMNCDALTGVFHCFTGTETQAHKMLALGGFKLGIGGVLTFKNAGLDKTLQNISLEHLILETDAPYLAPTPYRGKRNESSYIPLIAQKLADIKNTSVETVAAITTKNTKELFKLPI
ncbi:MAG: TatD family hydrolase [Bacteroidales bacterium]|nr:TatD family hydrolase [Bacteroidales bacterium]